MPCEQQTVGGDQGVLVPLQIVSVGRKDEDSITQPASRLKRRAQGMNLKLDLRAVPGRTISEKSLGSIKSTGNVCSLSLGPAQAFACTGLTDDFRTDFDIGKVLGSGTTATVCIATCTRQQGCLAEGQAVAVKIQTYDADEEKRNFARGEYELLSSLQHASIVSAYRLYDGKLSAAMVMEHCECGTLQKYVQDRGQLAEDRATPLGRQLLEAVDYMHSKRIVHRDLKPANLLLQKEATVLKISDFNSAQLIGRGHGASIMLSARGTDQYVAPELRFGQACNELVDVWACGLCLFFALRGELPFRLARAAVSSELAAGRLPDIDWGAAAPSSAMRNLILQCLTVNMPDRPPAMELLFHPVFGDRRAPPVRPSPCKATFLSCPGVHMFPSSGASDIGTRAGAGPGASNGYTSRAGDGWERRVSAARPGTCKATCLSCDGVHMSSSSGASNIAACAGAGPGENNDCTSQACVGWERDLSAACELFGVPAGPPSYNSSEHAFRPSCLAPHTMEQNARCGRRIPAAGSPEFNNLEPFLHPSLDALDAGRGRPISKHVLARLANHRFSRTMQQGVRASSPDEGSVLSSVGFIDDLLQCPPAGEGVLC